MKFMVIGATGLAGSALLKSAGKSHEVYGTFLKQNTENLYYLNITNKSDVDNLINKIKPDIIILTAALTNVDYCEDHHEETWEINVEGTRNIVCASRNINAKVAFISTDYVFDGKNGPYSENDKPNPINFYGKTKLEAEKIIEELNDFLIARTTAIYGTEKAGKNFVYRVINCHKSGKTVKVPVDQYGSPIFSDNLGDAIVKLCENNKKGIYNVAGPECINRYELALKVVSVFRLNKELIKPVKTSELNQKAPRPLYSGLKIDKIKNETNIKLLPCDEGLNIMKSQLTTNELC